MAVDGKGEKIFYFIDPQVHCLFNIDQIRCRVRSPEASGSGGNFSIVEYVSEEANTGGKTHETRCTNVDSSDQTDGGDLDLLKVFDDGEMALIEDILSANQSTYDELIERQS